MSSTIRALAALLAMASAAHARPTLDPVGMDRLAHYQVLTFTDPAGNGYDKGKAIGVFDATTDEVFRIVTDYERYPEFAPRVASAKVVDRQDDHAIVELKTDLPWPVSDAWVSARFEHSHLGGGTYRVRFWQVRGTMRRYFGSVLIEPWSKWRSAVTYELLAEPDSAAPRSFINKKVEETVGRYVHYLRKRINDLHAAKLLHPILPPNPNLVMPLAGRRQPVHVGRVAEAK